MAHISEEIDKIQGYADSLFNKAPYQFRTSPEFSVNTCLFLCQAWNFNQTENNEIEESFKIVPSNIDRQTEILSIRALSCHDLGHSY